MLNTWPEYMYPLSTLHRFTLVLWFKGNSFCLECLLLRLSFSLCRQCTTLGKIKVLETNVHSNPCSATYPAVDLGKLWTRRAGLWWGVHLGACMKSLQWRPNTQYVIVVAIVIICILVIKVKPRSKVREGAERESQGREPAPECSCASFRLANALGLIPLPLLLEAPWGWGAVQAVAALCSTEQALTTGPCFGELL